MAGEASKLNGKKGGRPKGTLAKSTLDAMELRKKLIAKYEEKHEAVTDALIFKAVMGDVPAIKELHDRVYGKSMQSIEMTGKDGAPINEPSPTMLELAKKLDAMRGAKKQ